MRSLVAPLYLIVSVGLSYLAALGLSVLLFVDLAGDGGLVFFLPFLIFVFLLALGEDYNILVMSRIREEAQLLPLRDAVSRALVATGTTVTSAGLVLGGTFSVFAIVGAQQGSSQFRDAAAVDPDVASDWQQLMDIRRANIAALVARLPPASRRAGLTSATAADTIWVIAGPDSHDMLVRQAGYSYDEYERWIRTTVEAAVLS